MKEKELKDKIKESLLREMLRISQEMEKSDPEEWIVLYHTYQKYSKMVSDLESSKWKLRIDPNTLILVAGNLAGILLILNFERAGIITSRAVQFVMKAR